MIYIRQQRERAGHKPWEPQLRIYTGFQGDPGSATCNTRDGMWFFHPASKWDHTATTNMEVFEVVILYLYF